MKLGKKARHLKTVYRSETVKLNKNNIDLSNNEAAYGKYRKYPYTHPLYESLSKYLNVSVDNILPVRGAEEGLKIVFDAFVEEGMNVIRPNPTFGMIEVYEKFNKANPVEVDYDENRNLNLKEFIKKINRNSLIYIANPDNPTGKSLTQEKLNQIINRAKKMNTLVLIDETYKEFNKNKVDFREEQNVVTVGSFSKSHGLAGIRLGYVIANKEIINILKKLKPMEEVNSVAVKEGINLNGKIIYKNVNIVYKWKKKFKQEFPTNYIDTDTNFILLKLDNLMHIYLQQYLYKNNILTKANFTHKSMKGLLRITVGSNREMKKTLRLIRRFFLVK